MRSKKNTGPRPLRSHTFNLSHPRFRFVEAVPKGVRIQRSIGDPWGNAAEITFASCGGSRGDDRIDYTELRA